MSQSSLKIAFQGFSGAYSELALQAIDPNAVAVPCASFEEVFAALESGLVDRACIPVDNSIAGRVADIHHLLPKSSIHIVAEHFQPIHHALLAPEGSARETIKEVHSHVHALGQCRKFLKTHGLKAVVHGDTAGAAMDVAKWNDPSKAAIASKLAAEKYHLAVLAENVEDEDHNTTRFLLLSKTPQVPEIGTDVVSTIFFKVRSVPAALYKAIGGFATNGINLTKIESYIVGESFSIAQFYIDVEGHPESEGMKHALDELKFFSTEVRILGTYPAHSFRRQASNSAV